jgi:hypothetical protein
MKGSHNNGPDVPPPGRIAQGQRVKFPFGNRMVEGVVTEDRGPLGINGQRLYQITFYLDPELNPDEPSVVELSPDEFTLVK